MISSFDPVDVFIFLSGFVFLLKKVAEMDRYHGLRVFVLTTVLSSVVIYLFLVHCLTFDNSCMPVDCEDEEFCLMG